MNPLSKQVLIYGLIATVVFVAIFYFYSRQSKSIGSGEEVVEEAKPEAGPYPVQEKDGDE